MNILKEIHGVREWLNRKFYLTIICKIVKHIDVTSRDYLQKGCKHEGLLRKTPTTLGYMGLDFQKRNDCYILFNSFTLSSSYLLSFKDIWRMYELTKKSWQTLAAQISGRLVLTRRWHKLGQDEEILFEPEYPSRLILIKG